MSRTKAPPKTVVSRQPTVAESPKSHGPLTLVKGTKIMVLADGKTRASGDAMRTAAKELGVEIPKTRGTRSDQELLGSLRMEISKRLASLAENEHIKCVLCGEIATDDTVSCPFCGDKGTPPPGADDEATVIEESVGIAEVAVATAPDVELATQALEKDLVGCLERISELKRNAVGLTYDMGLACREIRDRKLYTARGYSSFKKFAEDALPFARESALRLILIVEHHTREDYERIGFAKLRLIETVNDTSVKTELMEAAHAGATTKEIAERVHRSAFPAKKPPQPEKGERITLIGKVGARNQIVKFHDTATGEIVDSAGTFKTHKADIYGEHEVADGVFVRIGLRINTAKELEGLTVRFVRAADAAE